MTSARPASPWVVVPAPNPAARLRLFCFPYAGGGAAAYFGWGEVLPRTVELCAVQPPGREGRIAERPFDRVPPLVDALARELAPWLDRPFAFFGHSLGAVVAFELARRLRRDGRHAPLHLFASGRPAPHLPDDEPPLHALPDDELLVELRRLRGTPDEVLQNTELMELLLPLLRADFAASETYVCAPEPPLVVPISAYGGREDVDVPEERLAAWREQTTAAFRHVMFPGDHFFQVENRDLVLEELSRELHHLVARTGLVRAYA